MAEITLPPLPEPERMGGNDIYGEFFPLFTAEQMRAYAYAYAAVLSANAGKVDAAPSEVAVDAEKYATLGYVAGILSRPPDHRQNGMYYMDVPRNLLKTIYRLIEAAPSPAQQAIDAGKV